MGQTREGDGRLIDIDTGVLRADRVLVQRGAGAVVFLGLGPRAGRLCRFALDDDDDDDGDPFVSRCRRLDEALEQGDLAKACDHGIPHVVFDIADRPLRRLAIAEALAKAGFNPDEPRVPAGNSDGGQWTTDGTTGKPSSGPGIPVAISAHGSDIQPVAAQTGVGQKGKERFVDAHVADTQPAADKLGIPVENILAAAAEESTWGTSSFAIDGNNFFGIHFPAPHAEGYMEALGNTKIKVAAFPSYAKSLASFVATSGSIIQGKADPEDFARALQDSGKFGVYESGAKVPTYVHDLAATIRGIRIILARRRL
ncbi:MAG TPA: glucosaminidase domain-containing protein [Stellaceae bacterium]|nr:glucosaminidase domain-containing protein [Stellaceae bacterium]